MGFVILSSVMQKHVQPLLAKLQAGIGDIRKEVGTIPYYVECLKLASIGLADLKKFIRTYPLKYHF
jgi:hypothetical protein